MSWDSHGELKDPEFQKKAYEEELKRERLLAHLGVLYNQRDEATESGDADRAAAVEAEMRKVRAELANL